MRDHNLHDHHINHHFHHHHHSTRGNVDMEHEHEHDHTTSTATTTATTSKDPGARGVCAEDRGTSATPGEAAEAAGAENEADGEAGAVWPAATSGAPSSPRCRTARHTGTRVMRRLEEMSGGLWRPSPGSVYPHLQMLEDEGMVGSSEQDGTRTFHLTEAGVAEAAKGVPLPWQAQGESDDQIRNLRLAVTQLMGAAKQLSGAGENAQVERGIAVVQKARKELYQILAED